MGWVWQPSITQLAASKLVGEEKNSFSESWLVRSHSHSHLILVISLSLSHWLFCAANRGNDFTSTFFGATPPTFTLWPRIWRILRGRLAAVASDKRAPIIFNYFRAQMQSASGRYPLMSGREPFLPHFNSAEKMQRCIWIINAHLHVNF